MLQIWTKSPTYPVRDLINIRGLLLSVTLHKVCFYLELHNPTQQKTKNHLQPSKVCISGLKNGSVVGNDRKSKLSECHLDWEPELQQVLRHRLLSSPVLTHLLTLKIKSVLRWNSTFHSSEDCASWSVWLWLAKKQPQTWQENADWKKGLCAA